MALNGENHKDSFKTYIEQTKLLVTLASAFIIAPAATYTLVPTADISLLIISEILFVTSVISGYVVLATLSGSQADNDYDLDRLATRISSFFQIGLYVLGLSLFVIMIWYAKGTKIDNDDKKTNGIVISPNTNGFEIKSDNSLILINNDTVKNQNSCDSILIKNGKTELLIINNK